ncbi:hypothetical protein [Gaetbulibacter jejuensis]|uniref:hypothetical protein n=1 Tax=Gaetbulibacter jejuensis TaxID=584607 RepID=UPI003008B5AD
MKATLKESTQQKTRTNLQNPKKERQDYQFLTAIKEMINSKSLREEGFNKLQQVDADTLSVKLQVYYHYIKGKYFVLTFKDSNDKDVELLQYANDCYSDMVSFAYKNKFSLKEAKSHFARAYCKYLIATYHPSEDVKNKLFKKVEQISDRILNYNPDNESFLWLKAQLAS